MAEEEELILRVRLDDQSRAQIAAMQEQLRGVGGGASCQPDRRDVISTPRAVPW
jgi:hypothetical protein